MQTISRQQKDFETVRSVPDGKTTETRDTCGCIDAAFPLFVVLLIKFFRYLYLFTDSIQLLIMGWFGVHVQMRHYMK